MSRSSISCGSAALLRQLQLAQVLAQLRRHRLQAQQAVQGFLRLRLQGRSAVQARQAVLGDAQALVPRDAPQLDVVLLAPGKVVPGRGELRFGDDAQVRLEPVAHPHRGLGASAGQELGDAGCDREGLHHRFDRPAHGGDDVDVAVGLRISADAAGDLGPHHAGRGAHPLDELLRQGPCLPERLARRLAGADLGDAFQDGLLGLLRRIPSARAGGLRSPPSPDRPAR